MRTALMSGLLTEICLVRTAGIAFGRSMTRRSGPDSVWVIGAAAVLGEMASSMPLAPFVTFTCRIITGVVLVTGAAVAVATGAGAAGAAAGSLTGADTATSAAEIFNVRSESFL